MTGQHLELSCADADELAGLYVLDALDSTDDDAVRRHLASCPNPHPHFVEVGSVVPGLMSLIESIDPPATLRDRVIGAIAATPQGGRPEVVASTPLAGPAPISLAAERDRRASRFGNVWRFGMAAAAVLLIVVLAGTTAIYQRQAADAQARADTSQQQAADAQARADTLSAAVAASLDANSAVAGLHGSGVAASAAGFAAFPRNGTGYLVVHGLPQVEAGKTYQAWFVLGGTPHPSVVLSPGPDGLAIVQGLTLMPGAQAVALTIEPAGGRQTPSGPPVVVGDMQPGPVARIPLVLAGSQVH